MKKTNVATDSRKMTKRPIRVGHSTLPPILVAVRKVAVVLAIMLVEFVALFGVLMRLVEVWWMRLVVALTMPVVMVALPMISTAPTSW